MVRVHLTDKLIEELELTPNSETRYEIFDASVKSLAIRVGSKNKTFVLVSRFGDNDNTTRRMLGRFPMMRTEAACVAAHNWSVLLEAGIDPGVEAEKARKAEELRQRSTFGSVVQDYLAYIPKRPRNLSVDRDTYFIKRYILDPVANPWVCDGSCHKQQIQTQDSSGRLLHRRRVVSSRIHCHPTRRNIQLVPGRGRWRY